jgi:septal ring factor EnvC (AmiA/AmiB activator)
LITQPERTRKVNLKLAMLLGMALLLAGVLRPAWLYAASPQQTSAELKLLRTKIEAMTREISHDALERDRQSATLRAAEQSLGEAREQYDRTAIEIAERSTHRTALTQERATQQHAIDAQRAALAGQLRAAYLIGRQEPLKLLLQAQDPLRSARLFAYYGYFGRARAGQIAQIQLHVQQLDALDTQLARQQEQLGALEAQQQGQLQRLEGLRDERRRVLASLESQTQTREASLARLKSQQADLERLLRRLNRSLTEVAPPEVATAFGRLRGQLSWPVAGELSAEFGQTRASGIRWDGILVATARDAPVRAVTAGRMVYADWLPGLGLLAIIDHGEGYLSLYAHNDRLYKSAGEPVLSGELIAAAGDTGGRPAPELYFEIRHNGRPLDPRPWFREQRPSPVAPGAAPASAEAP